MKYEDLQWELVEGSKYEEAILELDENITLKIIKLDDDSFKVTYPTLGQTSETNLKQLENIIIDNSVLSKYFNIEKITEEVTEKIAEEVTEKIAEEVTDNHPVIIIREPLPIDPNLHKICIECINKEWLDFYDKVISFWEADNFWVLDETTKELYYDVDHRLFATCTFQIFKNKDNTYKYRISGVAFEKANADKFVTGNYLEALEQFALAIGVDNQKAFMDYYKHVRK
jgi:hypothetical protein